MKLIECKQEWDDHTSEKFLWLDGDKIAYSFQIEYQEGYWPTIGSVYVQEDYRGKGYSTMMIQFAIEKLKGYEGVQLTVRKDNFIKKMYESQGFEYYSDNEDDDKFMWMIKSFE